MYVLCNLDGIQVAQYIFFGIPGLLAFHMKCILTYQVHPTQKNSNFHANLVVLKPHEQT